jgi:hypothetical protein
MLKNKIFSLEMIRKAEFLPWVYRILNLAKNQ